MKTNEELLHELEILNELFTEARKAIEKVINDGSYSKSAMIGDVQIPACYAVAVGTLTKTLELISKDKTSYRSLINLTNDMLEATYKKFEG